MTQRADRAQFRTVAARMNESGIGCDRRPVLISAPACEVPGFEPAIYNERGADGQDCDLAFGRAIGIADHATELTARINQLDIIGGVSGRGRPRNGCAVAAPGVAHWRRARGIYAKGCGAAETHKKTG